MKDIKKVLLIGFGNPGRLDDGLGPALADAVEKIDIPGVTVDSNYQLTVEDSAYVAENDVVIFVDASVNCNEPFTFDRIAPKKDISFTTHSIDPESVLGLSKDLFKAETTGYVLGIRGYKFNEFGEYLSEEAKENLSHATNFIVSALREKNFNLHIS
ncbi:MAG: hydrogenase maturation protease [Candidatus Aureabacteria bacterium]|nr:hydrogenase maturation protease [Candidatus Auribacterota bacterium]